MAQWDSITASTARAADLLAHQMNSKVVQLVPDNMPFVKALVGGIDAQGSAFTSNIQTSKVVSGGKGTIRWQGTLPTVYGVTSESAAPSGAVNAARRGRAEFDLTHYLVDHHISVEETIYSKGDNWVDDFMGEELDSVLKSFWVKIATDVHGTGDQGRGQIGGLQRALEIDDNIGTYLGIARADSANVNLRAMYASGNAIDEDKILDLVTDIMAQGGQPDMIILSPSNYKTIRTAVDGAASYNHDAAMAKGFYGSKELFLAGIPVLLDAYCSSSCIYVLDTSTWQFQWDDAGIRSQKPVRYQGAMSEFVMYFDLTLGLACRQPRFNGKFEIV